MVGPLRINARIVAFIRFLTLSKKNTILTNQPCCRVVCAQLVLDWSALLSFTFIGLPAGADLMSKQKLKAWMNHYLLKAPAEC